MSTYGYCRISTGKQNIERQIRNIKAKYPEAIIVQEVYTGTKTVGRENWLKLLNKIQNGDTIIFDAVGRMSRDAEEGFTTYEALFNKGVNLIFLKEPHINTSVYRTSFPFTFKTILLEVWSDIIKNFLKIPVSTGTQG